MIEELIDLAKEMQEAGLRGEQLGLVDDELAVYDALETNESAVKVLGEPRLQKIAKELADTVRKNVTIDWTVRENVRAQLRVLPKRIMRKSATRPTTRRGPPPQFWSRPNSCAILRAMRLGRRT